MVPLCENLDMHEELTNCPTQWSPLASIPHLAAQLFAHWRNWGLLLRAGTLSQRVFSLQSLHDLCGFADVGPFVKVLRLVPDVFHQSLAIVDLTQKWVSLHCNRPLPASISITVTITATAAISMEQSWLLALYSPFHAAKPPRSPILPWACPTP